MMTTTDASQSAPKRVPITMSADEIQALQQLAKADQRSAASMARKIYLEGLKQFASDPHAGMK
jgi:hypothetical protein